MVDFIYEPLVLIGRKTIRNVHNPNNNKVNKIIIIVKYFTVTIIWINRAFRVLCQVSCVLQYVFRVL
jgi:hypothetical protein